MRIDPQTKIIIPAAGYGTRVGSPEAKELLPHPVTGRPLIEKSLLLARDMGATALVITRKEKRTLLEYLDRMHSRGFVIETVIIEPTKEWPASILAVESHWSEKNVLVLPDTEFAPEDILSEMVQSLEGADVVAAVFDPGGVDLSTFGVFGLRAGRPVHAEKPRVAAGRVLDAGGPLLSGVDQVMPWGLLAFKREMGRQLFRQMLESTFDHDWRQVPGRYRQVKLSTFRDLTRG